MDGEPRMDIETLRTRLRQAWNADTSASPEQWGPTNPALGQCAVTALVIQDHFGGDLLRCKINGISHYWNRLPDGSEIDLTKEQFERIESETETLTRTRDYVLGFPETVVRYNLLKDRLNQQST